MSGNLSKDSKFVGFIKFNNKTIKKAGRKFLDDFSKIDRMRIIAKLKILIAIKGLFAFFKKLKKK